MTRPTLAAAITIDQFWKTRGGQAVKIRLSTFQSRNLIDVRTWNTVDGRLKPTAKGFAAAIAGSLLLQHGCPLDTLRRALTRNGDGSASGPPAHVLDLLHKQTNQVQATE